MVPTQGLNHALGVVLKQETQVPQWYVGLFEGDFTPGPNTTAANLPAAAQECVAYTEAARVPLVTGPVVAGATSNSANLAEFNFTAERTVRGAFIVSAPAKGSTAGILLAVSRFPSPRVMAPNSTLRVFVGPTGLSIS